MGGDTMNVARIGLIVVAVMAAGGAALLVRTMTHRPPQQQVAQEAPRTTTENVLVAAHTLKPGALITPGDLQWQAWPSQSVADSYFVQKTSPDAMKSELGAFVRAQVEDGEPVTASKLVHAKDASFMSAMLTPGMRAVATKLSEASGAGGFILPGDRVDVILTRRVDRSGGSGGGYVGQVLFQNVRVLAIGQTVAGGDDKDKTLQGRTATLELTPQQAKRMAVANAMGDITLSLRSAVHGNITAATRSREADPETQTINVVRYARATRVTPMQTSTSGESQ